MVKITKREICEICTEGRSMYPSFPWKWDINDNVKVWIGKSTHRNVKTVIKKLEEKGITKIEIQEDYLIIHNDEDLEIEDSTTYIRVKGRLFT